VHPGVLRGDLDNVSNDEDEHAERHASSSAPPVGRTTSR
jgi:hypothetical protein